MSEENNEDIFICKCPCLANEEHDFEASERLSAFQPLVLFNYIEFNVEMPIAGRHFFKDSLVKV